MGATQQLLIAGGGIGAMAAALAVAQAGWEVRMYERTPVFEEVGAGVQLGPNVTRILHAWGLERALAAVAAFPARLQVRSASSGAVLGSLSLGEQALFRYGAPYATVHRADLHALLLSAVHQQTGVRIHQGQQVERFEDQGTAVRLCTDQGLEVEGDALLGADGVHSTVRQQLLADGPPQLVGDLAFRTLLRTQAMPPALAGNQVTAWLGPNLHVVQYPVRGGAAMNVVAIVRGAPSGDVENWDHRANTTLLLRALAGCCGPLRDLVSCADFHSLNAHPWRLWVLADRPPMRSAAEMARGLVGLLGDAAHPMRPYMAQGAGMAIEDAQALGQALGMTPIDVPTRLQRYALARWQRCARVQARSQRNGRVFHAQGLARLGRDWSMRLLGERLLDVPWLYGWD